MAAGFAGGVALGHAARIVFLALVAASMVIDARERRVPNALVLALIACALVVAVMGRTWAQLAWVVGSAAAVCGALVGFEVLWRRLRGSAGIGMGDIKVLFCMMLVDPAAALAAFATGLLVLALVAVALRRGSLPLMPFFGGAFLVLALIL
ncbi:MULTISPECIES: prepilin peptidase [Enorma]|uniref:prepilin peptidase n=1 Tax=Enorma TaxID=1472762 RepID=UPI00037B3D2E|nr:MULTISPECIES: prepilin peptidase [Enorma]